MIIRFGSAGTFFGFNVFAAMTAKVRRLGALGGIEYERDTSARILFSVIVCLQMIGGSQQLLLKVTRKDWRRAMGGEGQGEERELS